MNQEEYQSRRAGRKGIILAAVLILTLTVLFFLLPLCALFTRLSPDELFAALSEPEVRDAIGLSLITSLFSTIIIVLFGTPVAYLNARIPYQGKKIVETIIDLPVVLPPSVAGLALLLLLGRRGLIGYHLDQIGISIIFTTFAVIVAQTFVAGPLFIRQAKSAIELVDPVYESAARTLGAGRIETIILITLPMARTGLVSGIILSFARGIGEFGATVMVAGNLPGVTQTMPLAIYTLMQENMNGSIALALVLVLISCTILLLIRFISRNPP